MGSLRKEHPELLSSHEVAEKQPQSEHQEVPEIKSEVNEHLGAWFYVLAGFVTYVNVS